MIAIARIARRALAAMLFLWASAVWAVEVGLVTEGDVAAHREFASQFRHLLSAQGIEIGRGRPALVVTVGVKATASVLAEGGNTPVLAVLMPKAAFATLEKNAGARPFSAFFLDQPPGRQLALVKEVLPGRRVVGMLLGPDSATELGAFSAAAREADLVLVSSRVDEKEALLPTLKKVLAEADLLLALPDALVFNRNTAQAILLSAYRAGKPVVGYSDAYVRAGALAAVYASPADIARHAAEVVAEVLRNGALPPPRFPRYFSIAVNAQVARSMGLAVPAPELLAERLRRQGERE